MYFHMPEEYFSFYSIHSPVFKIKITIQYQVEMAN